MNTANNQIVCSFHCAIRLNDENEAKSLLDKYPDLANTINDNKQTPLQVAINREHIRVVQVLLNSGADPNIIGAYGNNALHTACNRGNIIIVELILVQIVNIDAKNKKRKTALHMATFRKHYDIVELLLDKGSNPNIEYYEGNTLLHHATRKNKNRLIKLLIKYGADIKMENKKGNTPRKLASYRMRWSILHYECCRNKPFPLVLLLSHLFDENSLFHIDYLSKDIFILIFKYCRK